MNRRMPLVLMVACLFVETAGAEMTSQTSQRPLRPAESAVLLDALVAEGARWWTSSGDPANPVACGTCHHDPGEVGEWVASFPKFRPLPPPHGRVMTLLQANAEAVRTHYRHVDPLPAATAITAFVTIQGTGRPPTPGVTPGQPTFPQRLSALAQIAADGRALFARRCAACHAPDAIAPVLREFPRVRHGPAESLERFLETHAGLAWDSTEATQVIAYLAVGSRGRAPRSQEEAP